jgi:hypothetical protein
VPAIGHIVRGILLKRRCLNSLFIVINLESLIRTRAPALLGALPLLDWWIIQLLSSTDYPVVVLNRDIHSVRVPAPYDMIDSRGNFIMRSELDSWGLEPLQRAILSTKEEGSISAYILRSGSSSTIIIYTAFSRDNSLDQEVQLEVPQNTTVATIRFNSTVPWTLRYIESPPRLDVPIPDEYIELEIDAGTHIMSTISSIYLNPSLPVNTISGPAAIHMIPQGDVFYVAINEDPNLVKAIQPDIDIIEYTETKNMCMEVTLGA